ncbi:MAG: pacearchaeosortase, partial [Nanoarchaeota archaeon]|nr:pacearchaeosortase [Nanoarchaeota archaeon]
MKSRMLYTLVGRYLLLLILGAFNLFLFYTLFTPLTVYPVYWFLHSINAGTSLLEGNIIFFRGVYAELVVACIGGSAYYLLLILNLTTPMKIEKRVKSIIFLCGAFLCLNILRILVFMSLLVSGSQYFDVTHQFTWYLGSTILVVGIWFVNVLLFDIKDVPVYTDALNIVKEIKRFPKPSLSHSKLMGYSARF